jgi:PAS domain S-box-containing protein
VSNSYISVQSNLTKFSRQPELTQLQLTKAIVDRAPDAIFCVEADGRIFYANDVTCNLTEYSRRELLSKNLVNITLEIDAVQWAKYWSILTKAGSLNLTSKLKTKSGRTILVELVVNYIQEGKEFCCIFVKEKTNVALASKVQECTTNLIETNQHLSKEVTQLKQTETKLANSLSVLQSTLESTANGIVALSFSGEILSYNQKFIDMWQVPRGIMLSKKCSHSQRFFEDKVKDPEAFRKAVWLESIQSNSDSYEILELIDGRTFAHHSKAQLLDGKIIGRVWSIWDISEFKSTKEVLKQNNKGFAALETTEAIMFIVRSSRLQYVNAATVAIAGYTKEELLSENFNLSQLIVRQTPTQQNGNPQYQEIEIVTKNGDKRTLAGSIDVIDFDDDRAELFAAIDITDSKNAEAEVRQALEQAKQLGEIKERFVSMLCHQFRTPLNVVSFSADLLKRHVHQWKQDKQLPYLAHIQVAVEQIGQLLEEIMSFSKIKAGKLICEPSEFDLDQFCTDIVVQMQLACNNQTQINLINKCDRQVYLDKQLLEPILNNLLSNAIKYSKANSSVTFEISCTDAEIAFQISDQGIGIPERDRAQLFEPFYRCSNVGDVPGTGLGLSMVKMLVEAHGGSISVVSASNGSTFTFVLPCKKKTLNNWSN